MLLWPLAHSRRQLPRFPLRCWLGRIQSLVYILRYCRKSALPSSVELLHEDFHCLPVSLVDSLDYLLPIQCCLLVHSIHSFCAFLLKNSENPTSFHHAQFMAKCGILCCPLVKHAPKRHKTWHYYLSDTGSKTAQWQPPHQNGISLPLAAPSIFPLCTPPSELPVFE